jgi:hypothetical protein
MKLARMFMVVAALSVPLSAVADNPPDKVAAPPSKPPSKTPSKTPDAPADKPADKPAAKVEVSKADADRFAAFFNKLIDLIVANQDDCAKMTTSMNGLFDANAALIKDGKEAQKAGTALPKDIKDKMDARIEKEMVPALKKKCFGDKGVQAAMQRMGG